MVPVVHNLLQWEALGFHLTFLKFFGQIEAEKKLGMQPQSALEFEG